MAVDNWDTEQQVLHAAYLECAAAVLESESLEDCLKRLKTITYAGAGMLGIEDQFDAGIAAAQAVWENED